MGGILSTGPHLDGILLEPRRQIIDDRGSVMHLLRADWPHFAGFGEAYVSTVKEGVVKAWKKHTLMVQHFVVPIGEIKLMVFDDRPDSPTHGSVQEIITGVGHYGLVRLPAGLWYGFKGRGPGDSLIINCATIAHDPAEVQRCDDAQFLVRVQW